MANAAVRVSGLGGRAAGQQTGILPETLDRQLAAKQMFYDCIYGALRYMTSAGASNAITGGRSFQPEPHNSLSRMIPGLMIWIS